MTSDVGRLVAGVLLVGHHDDHLIRGTVRNVQLLTDPVHETLVRVPELADPGVPIPGYLKIIEYQVTSGRPSPHCV